jgi:DNA-binding XRE family transcriptional regulator
LEQNKKQIQKLNKLRAQITSQEDQQQIAEQIQILGQTTQQIENILNKTEKGLSLFGWMFRLFTK